MKKFLVIILGLSIILTAIPISGFKAEASVPVFETNAAFLAGAQAVAGATTGTLSQDLLEWAETFILSSLKKQLLDYLVDQVIGSIQGGGEPQFVTDWQGFLADAGDRAAGEFAQEVGLGFLCSPFNFQIQAALLPVPEFAQAASCTLDDIVGNIEAFYEDFRNGGWLAYGASWNAENNFFGILSLTIAERGSRTAAAQFGFLSEALSGGGFLSSKKCQKDANGNDIPDTCVIVTPGSTVNDLVSKAVGSDFDFIVNAEQLGDYASAITNALINRLITEGLSAVRSATTRTQRERAADQYEDITDNTFDFLKSSTLSQIGLTLNPRQQAHSLIDGMVTNLNSFKISLNNLLNQFNNVGVAICQPLTGTTLTSIGGTNQTVVVANVKSAIQNEIAQADANIAQLLSDKANNQIIIDELSTAKSQIEPLTLENSDLTEISAIISSITDVIDPGGSSNFKSAIEAQNEAINQNISDKLATFNQQLQQCLNQP